MTGPEQERHVHTGTPDCPLCAGYTHKCKRPTPRQEQERHVGPLDHALVSAAAVEIIMTIGLGVIDDFAARAAAERVLRLALADQARRDHEHAHAILDELHTGGNPDALNTWDAALAAVRERL